MHLGILSQPSNFHCQKWSKALKKAGLNVTLFSLENFKIQGINCISFNSKYSWNYTDFYFTRKRLKEALKSEKIDVLHPLHLTPYGVWGYWTNFQPIIPAAMGADVFEYLPYSQIPNLSYRNWKNLTQNNNFFYRIKNKITKYYHRKMVQKVINQANYITADNHTLLNSLKTYFHVPENKLFLQRWGVEEEIFEVIPEYEYENILKKYGLDIEKPIILSPRGLMPIYQADIILDSFSRLVHRYKKYQWVMLSAGYPLSLNLKTKIQEIENSHQNFHCIQKQIQREEMAVIWKFTELFISAPIYDGYSATIAEGRYVGAIPVVNKIPGNEEVIQNLQNGIIVDPFSPENLTENLI